jgi:CBS domain-containing membrane protein
MSFLQRLRPGLVPTSLRERLRVSIGALTGICLTGFVSSLALGGNASVPLIVAPMGASAVLLFAAPASPLAQPWSILGGNVVAVLIGVTCTILIPDPLIAAGLAIALAIAAMLMLNCLHPPSGAVALTAVFGGPAIHEAGYWFALSPIALNSVILLSVALLFNNATGRRYPHLAQPPGQPDKQTADPLPGHRIGPGEDDIAAAIQDFDEIVPVSTDDLDMLFHKAQIRAFERQAGGIVCADVMQRDTLSVEMGTSLRAVWRIFMTRHVKALPVTDDKGHLVGIVSLDDFLENSVLSSEGTLRLGFGHSIIASLRREALPRRVDDIMRRKVQSAMPQTAISALVSPMVDQGIDQMPVVDQDNRLIGIISQSDLLAALFQSKLDSVASF